MTQAPVLPIPPEFSFEWESPEEAAQFWTPDLMHWPNGISPLAATMNMPAFGRGMNKALEELCMPLSNVSFKYIRGYVYASFTPYSHGPTEMEQRMQQMQAKMMEHVPGPERWRTSYEPEVRSINGDTLRSDYRKLGDRDLAPLFEQLTVKREREGSLHFLAVFPAGGAVQFFEQVYGQLFGAPKRDEHLQLLQGFPNKSVETDTASGTWRWRRANARRCWTSSSASRRRTRTRRSGRTADHSGRERGDRAAGGSRLEVRSSRFEVGLKAAPSRLSVEREGKTRTDDPTN